MKQTSNFLVYEVIITLLGGVVQNESFLTSGLHVLQLRKLFRILHIDTLQMDYLAYFNSVLKYGIIFWENCTDTDNVLILQKGQLEQWLLIDIGVHAKVYSRNLISHLLFVNTFFH
jgi:hypothetical protein